MSKYIDTNGIKLHYLEFGNPGNPTLILMHGLTANAHSFDRLIRGLKDYHVLSVDLRGRGKSDKPETNYSMQDHAKDILGLMDALELECVFLGGHSFGALLSIYLAANHSERVQKIVLMDAAAQLHPEVKQMVAPSMMRLEQEWPSLEAYMEAARNAPYADGYWNSDMEAYFMADITMTENDTVRTRSKLPHITQAIEGALGLGVTWLDYIQSIEQPAILINATAPYGVIGDPILPKELAMETVNMMKNCQYHHVSGNHLTMLFNEGADESAEAIHRFLNQQDLSQIA